MEWRRLVLRGVRVFFGHYNPRIFGFKICKLIFWDFGGWVDYYIVLGFFWGLGDKSSDFIVVAVCLLATCLEAGEPE